MAKQALEITDLTIRGEFSSAPSTDFTPTEVSEAADQDSPVIRVVREVLPYFRGDEALHHMLLYLTVSHIVMLPEIPVTERARSLKRLHPKLESHLRSKFLPMVFFALEHNYSDRELDIDGRIFLELLAYVIERRPSTLSDVIGNASTAAVHKIWKNCGSPSIDFKAFSTRFPLPRHKASPVAPSEFDVSVMPFENPLFQEAISSVQAVVLSQSKDSESEEDEDLHIPFSDTRHWHNTSTILPKHLGGEDRVALTDWQRERKLRSEQRFIAKMQWQAESLTGALGRPLQRITIVHSSHKSVVTKPTKPSTSQVRSLI